MTRCTDRLCPDRDCWQEAECPECGYLFVPDGDVCCPECGYPGRLEGVNHVERSADVYEDVQCGRCGSSMHWESCDGCDNGEYEVEGDWDEPSMYLTCPACNGKGGWWQCLSDYTGDVNGTTWCEGNPRPGRLQVPCSSVEEFAIHPNGTTTYKRGTWAELIGQTQEG